MNGELGESIGLREAHSVIPLQTGISFPRHSRHFLSGIHLGFLSDGYPPETAGMTAKRWILATYMQV